MTLVIGTDEAGYGPNLGPLVVAATAWHVAGDGDRAARLERAAGAVADVAGISRAVWGDSKRLYQPGAGLAALEAGVLGALPAIPPDAGALAERLGADDAGCAPAEWPALRATPLPVAAGRDAVSRVAAAVAAELPRHGVGLAAVRCRVVHPAEFNALLDRGLNKSDILSRTTLDLAAALLGERGRGPAEIWCDRHGGRKAYAGLVGAHFSAALVRTVVESPAVSRYEVPERRATVEFAVGGEARIPVALASMTAKYVRELAMAAFNAHWATILPGLVPTAGYPLDARRWWHDTDAARRRAGIPPSALWRRA